MSELLPIPNGGPAACSTHEERILDHCIARAIAGQPLPRQFVLSDRAFTSVIKRTRAAIDRGGCHGHVCAVIGFGSTLAHVVAGGLVQPDEHIDLVEAT